MHVIHFYCLVAQLYTAELTGNGGEGNRSEPLSLLGWRRLWCARPPKLSCSFTEYSWSEAMDTSGQQCRNSSYTTRNFMLSGIDVLWPGTKIIVLECVMECRNVDSNIYHFTNEKCSHSSSGSSFLNGFQKYLLLLFVIWWITCVRCSLAVTNSVATEWPDIVGVSK